MKQTWIKVLAGKLAAVAALLLFLALVPAAAAGTLPLWAVLVLGTLGVLLLNAGCGALLPPRARGAARGARRAAGAHGAAARCARRPCSLIPFLAAHPRCAAKGACGLLHMTAASPGQKLCPGLAVLGALCYNAPKGA